MNGYEIYLMIELAKCHGLITHELEYDTAWAEGQVLYQKFTESSYNTDEESEYDCINAFLDSVEEDLRYAVEHKSPKDEIDLNIQALTASFNGDMKLSNAIWNLIEIKEYKRLDNTMTLNDMKAHQKTLN